MQGSRAGEPACDGCEVLLRHPYERAIPKGLKGLATKARPQGVAQLFACVKCGTRWEQFRRKALDTATAVWRMAA
jgi:hypothetical protein